MAWMVVRGLALVGLVAGCSSSSDGDQPPPTFDELSDRFDTILDDGAGLGFTQPFTLPSGGSASYEGVLGIDSDGAGDAPLSMAGEMTLIADFDDDAVSGSVTDLVTDTGGTLDGSLSIHDGEIDRGSDVAQEFTFGFGLDGTLTDASGRDLDVSAEGLGDFLGTDHEQVLGIVFGTIDTPSGTAFAEGGFIGER